MVLPMAAAHLTTSTSATYLDLPPSSKHVNGYTTPYTFPRKYSALTKPRWICFALFLFFAVPAVGLAIDDYQRTPKVTEHLAAIDNDPIVHNVKEKRVPATPVITLVWTRVTIIELFITSAAIVLLWLLDVWYPLTFLSKPIGEVSYYLLLLAIHAGTIAFTVYALPQTLDWLSKTEFPMQAQNVKGEAWAMIACMAIQIVVLLGLCIIITLSIIKHTRNGYRDVLHHPTCRFDPNAPPPVALLGIYHHSMHRTPQSSYATPNNPSVMELGQLPAYQYPIRPPQDFHQDIRLHNHSYFSQRN